MVFRVEKTKNYTVMSNFHLRDKNLSLKAKGLLSWMLSNDDSWDYSIKGIVANCKESETAIESALDELKEFGYVHVTKLMPNQTTSGRIEYIYDVFEQPKQGGDFLPLEILRVENPRQRNTNIRNTNKEINTIPKGIVNKVPSEETEESFSNDSEVTNLSEYESKMFSEDIKKKRKIEGAVDKPKTKKLSLWDKCVQHIEEFTDDEEMRQALKDYLAFRLSVKDKPLFAGQWKGMLNKIPTLRGDSLRIIKQSLECGWLGFFDEKKSGWNYNRSHENTFSETKNVSSRKVSKEEWEDMLKNGEKF